jgi:hypothetical protein
MKNPGKTARAFIDGDRVSHYKPTSLAFVLASISAVISINVVELYKMMETVMISSKMSSALLQEIMPLVNKYNSYIMILFVPIVAVFTKFVFRKWGHNYYEHITMNAIGVSYYLIGCILILYPVLYFFKSNPNLGIQISLISFLLIPMLMIMFFRGVYPDKPLKTIVLKIFWMVFLILLCYILSIFLMVAILAILKGPESLEYMKGR